LCYVLIYVLIFANNAFIDYLCIGMLMQWELCTCVLFLYIVPGNIEGLDLICYPVNLIVECNAEWNVRMLLHMQYHMVSMYIYTYK